MDCRKSTSSEWFLIYLAIPAMLPAVWSAPTFSSLQTKVDLENAVNVLVTEGGKLYSEICKTPNLCGSSVEHLLRMDLKLPEITNIKSGCLSTNFDKKKCLPKIYRDLLSFQTYLDFLKESMPSNKNIIDSMQVMSIQLANSVKDLEEIPSEDKTEPTPGIEVVELRSKDPWTQNLTSYIILQSFKDYMEKTARAVRASGYTSALEPTVGGPIADPAQKPEEKELYAALFLLAKSQAARRRPNRPHYSQWGQSGAVWFHPQLAKRNRKHNS